MVVERPSCLQREGNVDAMRMYDQLSRRSRMHKQDCRVSTRGKKLDAPLSI